MLAPFFYNSVTSLLKKAFKKGTEALPMRMIEHPTLYQIIRTAVSEVMSGRAAITVQ